MADFDSIVVGSGLSGLTCGVLLAATGRRVLIVEQHSQPAPVVRGFSRDGLYFDSGFHYAGGLGDNGPLALLLRHLGILDELTLYPFAADGFDHLRIAATGENYSLPVGKDAIANRLASCFPHYREQISDFISEISTGWRNGPYLDINLNMADFGHQTVHEESLSERLRVFSESPALQTLLSMHSLLYGVTPDNAPLSLNSQVSGSYYHSVHGIEGGGSQLVAAFIKRIRDLRGVIRCCADVDQIVIADGKLRGVRLATREIICAPEVIVTCNPALLPQLLPSGVLKPAYRKRLTTLQQTPSALILYGRSAASGEILNRKNLFLIPQAGIVAENLEKPLEERPVYVTATRQHDSGHKQGIVAIAPTAYSEVARWGAQSRRSQEYRQWKSDMGEKMRKLIISYCPELEDLEVVEVATPLTLRDYSHAPEGAIYGVGRVVGQYNPMPATRQSGLYLSGQGVGGPGLLGTVVAGYMTCGTIVGHETLRGELSAWC